MCQVHWTTVFLLLALQFSLMVLLTWTTVVYDIFYFITHEFVKFVLYSFTGASGVYGLLDHFILMVVSKNVDEFD